MSYKLNIQPHHQRTCWIYDSVGQMIGRCNNYVEFNRARIEIIKHKLDGCVIIFDTMNGTNSVGIDRYGKVDDWNKFTIYEPEYNELPILLKMSRQSKNDDLHA